MKNNKPIGVFDSGIGGLTVLEDLVKAFPNENFLYFGDTLRSPYGTKSKEELVGIVESDIEYLKKRDVKMIVIACNTATANSYHIESNIPIIRIIKPTAMKAIEENKKYNNRHKILVCATDYTIKSKAYDEFLKDMMIGIPCSPWVNIIESGLMGTNISSSSVKEKVSKYKGQVDVCILGCTHFGLLEKEIRDELGDISFVNSSLSLKEEVKNELTKVGMSEKREKIEIGFSGKLEDLHLDCFKNDNLDFKNIKRININGDNNE